MPKKKTIYVQTYLRMPTKILEKVQALQESEHRVSLSNTIVSVLGRWFQSQKPHHN